jgi:NADH-quinone oxidoreductase E subunit
LPPEQIVLVDKYHKQIETILNKYPDKRSAILPLLYIAQQEYGYCTDDAIREVAEMVGVEPTHVRSVVGFYTLYHDRPVGKHVVQICDDLPCALRGADQFVDHVCKKLNLDPERVRHGGQTTDDGEFTFETVPCVAGCDRAPLAQIDLDYFENLDENRFDEILTRLRNGQSAR